VSEGWASSIEECGCKRFTSTVPYSFSLAF
jgi:hypothetical protein